MKDEERGIDLGDISRAQIEVEFNRKEVK